MSKIILLFLKCKIIASWIESFNIDVVEPNQVLKVVHQTYFRSDGRSFGEVIYKLVVAYRVVINVFGFQGPFQIETG